MKVNLFSLLPPKQEVKPQVQPKKNLLFDLVVKGLSSANQQQNKVEYLTQDFILGRLDNLHDLMIAAEKAEVSLQLIMTIRNTLIRAYQEIMAMGR